MLGAGQKPLLPVFHLQPGSSLEGWKLEGGCDRDCQQECLSFWGRAQTGPRLQMSWNRHPVSLGQIRGAEGARSPFKPRLGTCQTGPNEDKPQRTTSTKPSNTPEEDFSPWPQRTDWGHFEQWGGHQWEPAGRLGPKHYRCDGLTQGYLAV